MSEPVTIAVPLPNNTAVEIQLIAALDFLVGHFVDRAGLRPDEAQRATAYLAERHRGA